MKIDSIGVRIPTRIITNDEVLRLLARVQPGRVDPAGERRTSASSRALQRGRITAPARTGRGEGRESERFHTRCDHGRPGKGEPAARKISTS